MVLTAILLIGVFFDWWHWLDVLLVQEDWLSDFTDLCRLINGTIIIKESQCIRILRINISDNKTHNCKYDAHYLVLGLTIRYDVGQDGQKYHFNDCTNISSMIRHKKFHLIIVCSFHSHQ